MRCFLIVLLSVLPVKMVNAAVLDADRGDVLYHSYQGGGMSIDGPAVLVRKRASSKVAVSGFYYMDNISSASVDVESTASAYSETRQEGQLGFEYLADDALITLNLRQSDEDDYLAQSFSLDLSHDGFGDLTTFNLGLTYGSDDVMRNGDPEFKKEAEHYKIRAGIEQILTRNLVTSLRLEAISDQGFLNNPYRTVRYLDSNVGSGVSYQAEVYPETRNSFAAKVSARYFLPYRAAVLAHYRYFSDSWDIQAHDIELGYRHPIGSNIELEAKLRFYQQGQASFYADLFPYQDAQNYLARDKELSDFSDITFGLGATYTLPAYLSINDWQSDVSVQWDHVAFDYDNFRDPRANAIVGQEPTYSFSANVIRIFVSIFY